ncbi:DegV family protein [uncultured Oscillibacter sp.]|uniref:DegV family protein n=1 Tax=uncultured Oscillibacter sp. TaxID=876091 RepID=UPI0025ED435E|nr:DegV family protein [uncultured Oscillibacter sp.]
MRDYVIMTDSCCDLTAQMAEELELAVLPLSLEMGGQTYRNWLDGRDIPFETFYGRLRSGETATTSAVSVGDFEEAMRPILAAGKDILCLSFSSALSTTYQSASIAAQSLAEEFPQGRVLVVDSLCASLGQGLFVYLCAMEKRKGRSLEELRRYAEDIRGRVCHWFTVDDLNHLKRGGRINAATALFGTMLAIKPVMHVDDEGRLIPVSKARGRKASLLALVDHMEQTAADPAGQTVFISHGDCAEDAGFVAEEIRRRFGTADIRINYVGPVIGNHSGPGTVALFFLGNRR